MNNRIILILSLIVATQICQAQPFASALDYLEYINAEYSKISDDSWSYIRAASHSNSARKIEKRRTELVATISESRKKISRLSGYGGNTAFKDAVVNYLSINHAVLNEDYVKIVNMEEIAEQSYDNMEAYMLAKEHASNKLDEASQKVSEELKNFGAENNITITDEESKRSEKIKASNVVYKHYNDIYLIFFKSNKQEMYLVDAIGKSDLRAIEQNRNALSAFAAEGKEKLKDVKVVNNDQSLKQVTNKLFDFYKEEADVKTPLLIDFFVKKEEFEKIKSAVDNKKPAARTKEDIDKYNAALKEYNSAVNSFNNIQNELNSKRTSLINEWNKTGTNFIDKHVPKGK